MLVEDGGRVVRRAEVALDLQKEAAAVPNITVHFQSTVSAVDFLKQEAVLESSAGGDTAAPWPALPDDSQQLCPDAPAGNQEPAQLQFDLLVGADGSGSQVRKLMQNTGYISTSVVSSTPRYYKTFANLHVSEESQDRVFGVAGDRLKQHSWQIKSQHDPKDKPIGCIRTGPAELSGIVSCNADNSGESSADLEQRFGHTLPRATCRELADKLAQCPLTAFGKTTACSAYHAPGTVLLGDAAHAALGQGANVAVRHLPCLQASTLESASVLCGLLALERSLQRSALPLAQVPAEFTAKRWKDARALQRMDRLRVVTAWPELQPPPSLLEKLFGRLALRTLPSLLFCINPRINTHLPSVSFFAWLRAPSVG